MELKQLRIFVAAAEQRHFGHAARQLGIAQPQVSRVVKALEDGLSTRLFRRERRGVALSAAGEVLLAEARLLLRDADLARDHVRESALGRRGRLRITMVGSAMLGRLPVLLGAFREDNPAVAFTFRELGSQVQLDALAAGESDIGFMHPPQRVPEHLAQLVIERVPVVAAVPARHRLAARGRIRLDELADEPWIMMPRAESAAIHDRIVAICRRAGFSPRVVQEAGHVHVRLGLVAAGFGVHLLQARWAREPFPGVAYLDVAPQASLAIGCYWRRGDPNPLLSAFIARLRREVGG
jgi:DNA-binding transcriptional LysR family regulator